MSLHGGHVAGVNPTLSIGGPEMSRYPLAGGGMKHECFDSVAQPMPSWRCELGDRLSRGHPGLTFPRLGR
jgi:hypothetical protein